MAGMIQTQEFAVGWGTLALINAGSPRERTEAVLIGFSFQSCLALLLHSF